MQDSYVAVFENHYFFFGTNFKQTPLKLELYKVIPIKNHLDLQRELSSINE